MGIKKKYCLTLGFKILMIEFLLNFIGLLFGYSWQQSLENDKWSNLIYNNIKIEGINLGGKTKQQAITTIQSKYIDKIRNKKLNVTIGDKVYSIDTINLIKGYKLDESVTNAFNIGKNLSAIKKHQLIKYGCNVNLRLKVITNDSAINEFIKNIEKEANKDPVNANINVTPDGNVNLNSDSQGYKLKTSMLYKEIINSIGSGINKNLYIKAPVEVTKAVLTATKLSLINESVSSFKTGFQSSSYNRINNINICAKALDGIIVMPGEEFSFNKQVGERTKERGYLEAPVIVGNEIESGFGGGICQVSSTLYNAIIRMGIEPTERFHHSMPSSYVGIGLDATVDWGNMDLKFKNILGYPMYLQVYTKDDNLYVDIFSNSELNKRKYVIENSIYEVVDENQEKVIQDSDNDKFNVYDGHYGYKVKVLRKTYIQDKLVNYEVVSDDYYPPSYPPLIKSTSDD